MFSKFCNSMFLRDSNCSCVVHANDYGSVNSKFQLNIRTNEVSFEHADAQLYSARAEESATTLSLRDENAIGPTDMNTAYPQVDFGAVQVLSQNEYNPPLLRI